MIKRVLATAAALAAFSGAASASVTYDFTALSAFPVGNAGEQITGSFSVTLPNFVAGDTNVATSDTSSCSVTSNLGPAACGTPQIFSTDYSGYDTIEFGISTAANPSTWIYYYFDPSAFSAPGTYQTVLFGSDQAGTLVVSSGSTVPEPAAWMLMLAGAGVLARRARRRTEA